MTEKQLENKMKGYLKSKNIYHFKVHGNGFMRAGIPDLICCVKGLFVAIEVKRPDGKGKLSKLQEINIEQIQESGGIAIAFSSYEPFKILIDKIWNMGEKRGL